MAIQIVDQIERAIVLKGTPKRIVSLVPSQTELLCDLGLQEFLVGITKFCIHPSSIKKQAQIVGGTKSIHLDKIRALRPDIILCNKEENTKDIVKSCEDVCAVHVSDVASVQDSLNLIRQYGKIFDRFSRAELICEIIQTERDKFSAFIKGKPKLKVSYFIWKNPWMVAANNTFIDHLLQLNNFENAFGHLQRYPIIDLREENVEKDNDLILLSSEPFPFRIKHKEELKKYFPYATILLVDGEMFSWYGSRLIKAFQYFRTLH